MLTVTASATPLSRRPPSGPHLVAAGALAGLAWSCALRGWMVSLAGPDSQVTWSGTLAGVLAPAGVVGGLLGWAEHRRRQGAPTTGWLVASPALLALAPLALPGMLTTLRETGQGSGAIGMVSLGMLAGFSVSGRGRRRLRLVAGAFGFAAVPAIWLGPPMRPELATSTPYGALAAATFSGLFVSLSFACSIPMRRHLLPTMTEQARQ